MNARGVLPDLFAGMNKLEAAFAAELEAKRRMGLIHSWAYERVTLKLADDCRYTPDFFVVHNDGVIEFVETKGFFRDDAKVKIAVAATEFPYFKFTLVKQEKDRTVSTSTITPA